MDALVSKTISTPYGDKTISVHAQDIVTLNSPFDIMTISSFQRGYSPTEGTLLGTLNDCGIPVHQLALNPKIDLRETSNIWLSHSVPSSKLPISRVGCIELISAKTMRRSQDLEAQILSSIQSYFHMLHIASLAGIRVARIGLPVLGAGNQSIDSNLVMVPTINECIRFLRSCPEAREMHVITKNQKLAFQFATSLESSYSTQQREAVVRKSEDSTHKDALAFISYSSLDKNIADNLCAKLERAGVKVWYAPRDIVSADYASAIVNAISHCTHFVVILSRNSLQSQHVLNEIDLAFQELSRGVTFMPLKIDAVDLRPSFRYYLSRQHWMDAHFPPLEERLEEFVSSICAVPPR